MKAGKRCIMYASSVWRFLAATVIGHFLLLPVLVVAQNSQDDFRERRESFSQQLERERQQYIDSTRSNYTAFLRRQDAAFAEFLQREWVSFQAHERLNRSLEPKPKTTPTMAPTKSTPESVSTTPPSPIGERQLPSSKLPPAKTITTRSPEGDAPTIQSYVEVQFYGQSLTYEIDPGLKICVTRIDEVSGWWTLVARSSFFQVLDDVVESSLRLRLNDWGQYMLVNELCAAVHPGDDLSATALSWFLLVQAGFDVRLGYTENHVYLLVAPKQIMYNTPYVTVEGVGYYILMMDGHADAKSLKTYDGRPPRELRRFDLLIDQPPDLVGAVNVRNLALMTEDGEQIALDVSYCAPLVDFYLDYPQTLLSIHCSLAPNPELIKMLSAGLADLLLDCSEVEGVFLLMQFVQKAFEYKRDEEQFDVQNYSMFPEEVVFYPFSDCEDRCAIFSFLVRKHIGLDTAIITYPGHAAVAVAFSDASIGSPIRHGNRNFTICDPTYIGALPGMCIPKYSSEIPKVVCVLPAL